VCVVAGLATSTEAAALVERGSVQVVRPQRQAERAASPLVETTAPEREDRSPRLGRLLREADGAFLLESRMGYGTARACRRCGEPARCARCSGAVVLREGRPTCAVCHADAVCPTCGSERFAVERAWRNAGLSPAECTLLEGHGTSTSVGDAVEPGAPKKVRQWVK
jgi:primosomal protein N' (replication factor Y) (superfamily II helicase)